ncbi:hypothetical protein W911_11815 [Hyphomicrobium nitrativorans NL23]|uniref:Uncharacterized protein n=1 Tax=Hyphomicrobium nitrativorans NL23 TaxID=1029756 RepID=V5SG53_9HYPH|nr:hypothetical protein [Hyphomicrobium nitrativorans]AHB48934.1 hypothetical protein W911_11815 [Hyphomicrobium nitrativorans NL23]
MSRFRLLLAGAVVVGALAPAGYAHEQGHGGAQKKESTCTEFIWPLETERAWFRANDALPLKSGDTFATPPTDKAIRVQLRPSASVELPAPPTSTPKPDDAKRFAGVIHFKDIKEGHYQVAISTSGWIDVVQGGKALEATAHTGSPHCDELRKSVRFEIAAGPFSVQVYGVPTDTIRFAVRPAAD